MKKSKISSSIIEKIKKEKIEQHSKLYFLAKFSLILLGGIIFFLIGVIATAVIWHFFHDTELLAIFSVEKMLFLKALLFSFPIFWVMISILLGIFAGFFAKNTKKGYKIPYKIWLAIIILAQILGGLALEQSPLIKHLEHHILRQINILKSREKMFNELWQNPEKGLLIGEIFERKKEQFILKDLNNKEWTVSFKKSSIHLKGDLENTDKVRVFGEKTGEDEFFAEKIVGKRFDFQRPPREKKSPTSREKRKRILPDDRERPSPRFENQN